MKLIEMVQAKRVTLGHKIQESSWRLLNEEQDFISNVFGTEVRLTVLSHDMMQTDAYVVDSMFQSDRADFYPQE